MNICRQSNPLCKDSNVTNGACLDCYQGYLLRQGGCILPSNLMVTEDVLNVNCRVFDDVVVVDDNNNVVVDNNKKCLECYPGYRNSKGVCI